MNAWRNLHRIDTAHSLNISAVVKRTQTRSQISQSKTLSRCATKPHHESSARRKSSIIYWKVCSPEGICRFTRWSHLRGCPIPRQRDAPGFKTALSSAVLLVRQLCYSLRYCWCCFTNTNEPNLNGSLQTFGWTHLITFSITTETGRNASGKRIRSFS